LRHVCLYSRNPEKEETITGNRRTCRRESAWGPAPTIAAPPPRPKPIPRLKNPQSISVVTREEMEMKQPTTVKEALAYTPSVFSTRGSVYL
jgi:iron complex outermembrane receptor protein